MASVASQLIEKVTAHAQSDSLDDAREICADGTYFPNNLHSSKHKAVEFVKCRELSVYILIVSVSANRSKIWYSHLLK